MPKQFNTPEYFKSPVFTPLKKDSQKERRDLSPYIIEKEKVIFKVARYFGFCFGVENAIEVAYKAVDENPTKRVFLLSDMIHNPMVNEDLKKNGVQFIQKPDGTQLIPFEELNCDDVVILPAFGVSLETLEQLKKRGIDVTTYDATCPFVEKVWKRSYEIGANGFAIVVHGKHFHEETKATFSHAKNKAPTIIVRDKSEAEFLCNFILGEISQAELLIKFEGKYSVDFKPERDLKKIGVVNQTTMIAEDTHEIAEIIKSALIQRYGAENIKEHFADTKDTICYATSENQNSVKEMIKEKADIALIVGGSKSSNTSHLAKIAKSAVTSYHIEGEQDLISQDIIRHVDFQMREFVETKNWLPKVVNIESKETKKPIFLLTAGASTPDSILDRVIKRVEELI